MNIYHKESIKKYLNQTQIDLNLEETTSDSERLRQEGFNKAILMQRDKLCQIIDSLEEPAHPEPTGQTPHHNHD